MDKVVYYGLHLDRTHFGTTWQRQGIHGRQEQEAAGYIFIHIYEELKEKDKNMEQDYKL